jgi:hypothetical protein
MTTMAFSAAVALPLPRSRRVDIINFLLSLYYYTFYSITLYFPASRIAVLFSPRISGSPVHLYKDYPADY